MNKCYFIIGNEQANFKVDDNKASLGESYTSLSEVWTQRAHSSEDGVGYSASSEADLCRIPAQ